MKKSILLITLVLTFSSVVFAGASGTLRYTNDPAISWKDGTVMGVTNSARGICNISGSIQPPTATAPYTDATDEVSTNPGTPFNLGYNGLSYNPTVSSHGGMMGVIEASAGADAIALFRVWSAMSIENSVYYVDGGSVSLSSSSPPSTNDSGSWNCDQINPAYVITFSSAPDVGVDTSKIVGTVANVGTGNNEMPNNFLEVVYSGETSGTETVDSDGSFEFIPGIAGNYDVYVRVKNANTPRNGFPISASHLVTPTPEPGIIGMVALGALAFFRKK